MYVRILKDSPLLIRLILLMALFTFLLALALTAIEMKISYNREMHDLNSSFESIQETQIASLGENLWQVDSRAVEIQMKGIINNSGIVALKLTDNQNMVFVVGDTSISAPIRKKFPVVKTIDNSSDTIGVLELYGSNNLLVSRIKSQVPYVILGELVKLIGASVIILILFFLYFHRHLQRIVAFTDTLSLTNLNTKLVLSRPLRKKKDELDRLVQAVNSYGERIADGFEQVRIAEESLRSSEEMYRHVYNAPDEAIFIHDGNTTQIMDVNSAAKELYGFSLEEFRSFHINEISSGIEPYTEQTAFNYVKEAIRGSVPKFEWRAKKKNGELFWVSVTLRRMPIGDAVRVIAFVRDITEQNRLEDNLRQSQKMEAIGTLAGGVAHDFNNILSGIVGFSELALLELTTEQNSKAREYMDEVLVASDRAKELVEQILLFSRKSGKEKKQLEFTLLVKESLKLLRSSIPSTITFVSELNSSAKILAEATRIHQVVMNLCTNAYHAMQDHGGVLTVSTSDFIVNQDALIIGSKLAPGEYIRLSISDTGIGMSQDTVKRIFDPYFTTKSEGHGTGLGLSMVHGIVKDHGGDISVYSELGKGTTFHIYLPALRNADSANMIAKIQTRLFNGENKSVLFVDDEEMIRKVAIVGFRKSGYQITTCVNGSEAWEMFRGNPSMFDIVITDVTMPVMTGVELASHIRSIDEDIPIIVCSGFTMQMTEEVIEEYKIFRFLHKPVMMNVLFEAMREAFGQTTLND